MRQATLAFLNGHVLTLDDTQPRVQAVAVQDNHILALGSDAAIREHIGPRTDVIDLRGRTLVPGFHDSHIHLLRYGLFITGVDLTGVTSLTEVVAKVRAKAAVTPPGQWILGFGWDQNLFREGRFPHRSDLDLAAPDHPVSLTRVCVHLRACNSLALQLAGITRDTPNPENGEIVKDAAGEPTGILSEAGANILVDRFTTPASYTRAKPALRQAMSNVVAAGITSVTTDDVRTIGGVAPILSLFREAWGEAGPVVRSCQLIYTSFLDELQSLGLTTGDGDARVRVGAQKILQDGGLGGRTATLREPYTNDPGNQGMLLWEQSQLNAMVARGHNAGMQVAIHALGDAAIASCLTAFELALRANPRTNHRHRIIHFNILSPDLLAKTRELGVGVDIQPRFVSLNGRWVEASLGAERAKLTYAWKTILDSGIPTAGGSDCPVERFEPLLAIHNAVNRQVDSAPGTVFLPSERLTPLEAMKLYTSGSAYSTFEEDIKGSFTPGKLADLVVLSDDPCTVPPETIKDVKVEMTIVDGKIVYEI